MKRSTLLPRARILMALFFAVNISIPQSSWACACGCGLFEVGTPSRLPTQEGGTAFVEYDLQNQDRNWNGSSPSSADNNEDKKIISQFFTVGGQYMVNRRWGALVQIPFAARYFKMADETSGDIMEFNHTALGDVRLKGIYTGFFDDMSTGLTLGLKLPTGSFKYDHFDPDVQIGSGSTDLLMGGFHRGAIVGLDRWQWYVSAEIDQPILHYTSYIPGSEVDAALGMAHNGWSLGPVKVAPLAQVSGAHRWSDSGDLAAAESTGFSRVYLAPGLEFDFGRIRLNTNYGFRVYQYTTGAQLVASQYLKVNIGYRF